ncbi:MAG: hypothetical protein NC548_15815 [Lachnospiraceae bacterium]|nr:hypothetical protein [Lachnospiraceae bacterium]
MIEIKDMTKLLDRLQVLFTIYTAGEEALPREMKPLIQRYRKDQIENGEEVFYCKCLGIDSIDAVYRFQLRTDYDFNPLSKKPDNIIIDMIVTDTDEYCIDKDTGEIFPVIFDERSSLIKFFIPKTILEVNDLRITIGFIASMVSTFFDVFIPDGISYTEKAKYVLMSYFINITFLYGVFSDSEKIKKNLVFDNDSYQPNMLQSVINFIESNYNFETQYLSEILKTGIENFENGDNKFWSDITKEVRFDKIISTQDW